MTLTKLIKLQAAVHKSGWGIEFNQYARNFDFAALDEKIKRYEEALRRSKQLVSLLTVKQVIEAGDSSIDAAGLNPWCMNEGLADGHERISTDYIDRALEQ